MGDTSASLKVWNTADDIERIFSKHGCRLPIHTRREAVEDNSLEEHLHWSSPLGTTVDVRVSCDKLSARWSSAPDWTYMRLDQVDEIASALAKTGCWLFANPCAERDNATRLININPLTLSEILSYLPFADICRLLQTGSRPLLRNMKATHIDCIDAATKEDVSCLLRSVSLRKILPLVRTIHVHRNLDPYNAQADDYDVSKLPRTITSLRTPPGIALKFGSKDIAEPFTRLQFLRTASLYPTFPVEVFMPSLTSLNILHTGGGSGRLECNAATALPSMLHELFIPVDSWEGLMEAVGDAPWPFLHTLQIRQSLNTRSLRSLPNAARYPLLSDFSVHGWLDAVGTLDSMSDMHSMKQLTIGSWSVTHLAWLLHNTTQTLPPCLTSVAIHTGGDSIDYSSINSHLARLLPHSVQKITLRNLEREQEIVFDELTFFPNLTRICLEGDEHCKVLIDGSAKWQSFSLMAHEADNVEPSAFDCFELVHNRQPIHRPRAHLLRSISDLICNCPSVGLQMACRWSPDVDNMRVFSVTALHRWLGHATCPAFDCAIIPLWSQLLYAITSHHHIMSPASLIDALHCHSTRTHPTLFRYLLHITFLHVANPTGAPSVVGFSERSSKEIISHLASQYGYHCTLDRPESLFALMSLTQFVVDFHVMPVKLGWKNLIEMMERPSWADACCKGDIAPSPWFDQYHLWRAACILKDLLLAEYPDQDVHKTATRIGSFDCIFIEVRQHQKRAQLFRVSSDEGCRGVAISVMHLTRRDNKSLAVYFCYTLDETKSRAAEAVHRAKTIYTEYP